MLYTIRFAILNPNSIHNICGPDRSGKAQEYIDKANKKKNGFFTKLEKSILDEGFRNPILVNAGFCHPYLIKYLPQDMIDDPKKILMCWINGGSRLWFAVKYDLMIPCIISDAVGRFENEELVTEETFDSYYKDGLRGLKFGENGITIKAIKYLGDSKQNYQSRF